MRADTLSYHGLTLSRALQGCATIRVSSRLQCDYPIQSRGEILGDVFADVFAGRAGVSEDVQSLERVLKLGWSREDRTVDLLRTGTHGCGWVLRDLRDRVVVFVCL